MPHHLHPFIGKMRQLFVVHPLHTVDRGDLQSTQPGTGILFQVVGQVVPVYRATHPPPAGTGTGFRPYFRPAGLLGLYRETGHSQEKKKEAVVRYLHIAFFLCVLQVQRKHNPEQNLLRMRGGACCMLQIYRNLRFDDLRFTIEITL